MHVFVAGGSGVVGRSLVAQLAERGHRVTATTTSRKKVASIEEAGGTGIVMDGLDAAAVGAAVATAQPDAIVHEMTAISVEHAGQPDVKHTDRWFAQTNRLRSEGTDNLLAAAQASGVEHVVAQGYAAWNGEPRGGWVKTEEDPLNLMPGTAAHAQLATLKEAEDKVVSFGGAVVRYGALYGPGAIDDQIELIRRRKYPLVGHGTGHTSWVHVDDAAGATVLAVEQGATGIYNVVDDEPAPASEFLPYLAACAGARRPRRVPVWLARLAAGDMAVTMMTEGRGFSNAKAKRELGWTPRHPSWREGFKDALA